jgi:Zn-finger nucleic acid-binding protein
MTLWQQARGEFIDVIAWDETGDDTLVWRFPRQGDAIKWGAQLIVREGQQAVFVNEGRVADRFGPGRHRLSTRNLPLLTSLLALPTTLESPFKAEVYFVAGRRFTDLKWGTRHPLTLRDPELGPVWAIDPQLLQALAESPRAEAASWRYLPCPSCGELMHRQLHGRRSGVVVDRCRDHGLWLDAGELRQLLEWTRAGGQLLEQQRRLEQERDEARQQAREQTDWATASWGPGEADWRGDSAGEPDLLSLLLRLARLLR